MAVMRWPTRFLTRGGTESEVAVVGTIVPLEEEPEPPDAFEDAPGPYMIGYLLKNCRKLAEYWEVGSRYGL